MLFSPALLGVALLLVLGGAIPTRRLGAAGFRAGTLGTYLALVVLLGLALYLGVLPARFIAPVLAVVYVAPLVAPPELLGRLLRRRGSGSDGPGSDGAASDGAAPGGARPVGSGPGRTVWPDGTVEPDPEPHSEPDAAGATRR